MQTMPPSSGDTVTGASPLDALFAPRSVAVVGATERVGSVGRTIVENLINGPFPGPIYPVNLKSPTILGLKAYPSLSDIPNPVDLIVVVTPAPTVPAIIREGVDIGARGAIVISAGFREVGPEGAELERQVLEEARRGNMRIIGPNCLGLMNPARGLNATFASTIARPGNVAFISQSGALCTSVLDWSLQENVGFSAFVSIGTMLDVGWGDLIDYLGNDPNTRSIVLYMESIGDARTFISAAREVALNKPIIIIKAGRTAQAAQAAASHTGALTGSDEVLDAAFQRCGVLRVNSIGELFDMAEILAKQPRPAGPRLTILTNAGGPGVLATDALINAGGQLAELAPETIEKLNEFLPTHWSHGNPVDILGDADANRYLEAIKVVAQDPNSDGVLITLTPQAMSEPTQVAEQIRQYGKWGNKPILASWMGGAEVAAGVNLLNQARIPSFTFPDTAAEAFTYMWRYTDNLRGLYETPVLSDASWAPNRELAKQIIDTVRNDGRTLLSEAESKQLLAAYGIPVVETRVAQTLEEAVQHANEIGYPIVLKLFSETITHKTDVGGVKLNLVDEEAVRTAFADIKSSVTRLAGAEHFGGVTVQPMINLSEAYELIVGASADSQLGPVLLFGTGGQLVEVFQDRALALPPLTTTLARRMMEKTRIYKALNGVRGRQPVDLKLLEQIMVRFSQLVAEQRWIKEIDINPLSASAERLVALDGRVVLYDKNVREEELPQLAIRPYPTQYVENWELEDGTPVVIRPIRPEDEPLMVEFHGTLSERSVYMRYFSPLQLSQRIAHERLTRICFVDYDRQNALVVERTDAEGKRHILGVGRLIRLQGTKEGEYSMLISDNWQGKGIGTELLRRLIQIGRDENLERITAEILPDNRAMQKISQQFGFRLERELGEPVRAVLDL
jgi:acetyltransferase